jgi:hypothetical protein
VDGSGSAITLWEATCGAFQGVTVDANNLYVACPQQIDATHAIQIVKIPKNGTAPSTVFTSDTSVASLNLGVEDIGTDGSNVYFSENNQTGFYSIPVAGGSPTRLTPDPQPNTVHGFNYITGYAGNVYWLGTYGGTGSLLQLPNTGGTPMLIANADPLYGQIDNLVIQGSYFYWKSLTAFSVPQALYRMPIAGGTPSMVASFPTAPGFLTNWGQMTIFGDYMYAAGQDGHGNLLLESYPLNAIGTAGVTSVVATIPPPNGYTYGIDRNHVHANSTHLFIADPGLNGDGHIYRCQ